ncbi:MAG TPA: hypothetical protein VK184_01715 [Nostocaceae cyanobacterium]|nr:hypothetical protein [Nostocaceae cyanobacterium]
MTVEKKIQQALKWWSYRQAVKLFLESEKIRDTLLQECFIIRRNFDLLTLDNFNLSNAQIQEYLQRIENLHYSLVKLSNRLCPSSIQDSLPLSIECLLQIWLDSKPNVYFNINLPVSWQYESAERNLIILNTLEELLTIILPDIFTPVFIKIDLKKRRKLAQLNVKITYPDISTLIFHTTLPELEYLCDSFKFLLSGKCLCQSQNLNVVWSFYW